MNLRAVLIVWAAAAVAMLAGWLVQRKTGNAGIVDAVWSACMSASAMFYAGVGSGGAIPRFAVAVLGGFWGFRLCMHILARVLTEEEDGRYRYLRQHWHNDQGKLFLFFQAQALLVGLFSLPFLAAAENPENFLSPWITAGVMIWATSLGGETIADLELARFRRNSRNRGKTCRDGLWRYSRHPNYFFEWLHWFAYVAIAMASPLWWLAWSGPVLMLISLRWVTGIPFVEAQALRSRGDDYRAYQRDTSIFVPWFPKRSTP